MNISSNLSSINAHQTMLNNSAHNVANVNTDKFVPSDTKIKNDDNSSNKSQTDLAKEIPDQMVALRATEVNISSIKTQDEMLGSLLDMKA